MIMNMKMKTGLVFGGWGDGVSLLPFLMNMFFMVEIGRV